MTNCVAALYQDTDTLDAGQRVAGEDQATLLASGPAYLSAPARAWEQAAALEGMIAGTLHLVSSRDLSSATRVEVQRHTLAGTYRVTSASPSGSQWRVTLSRRPLLEADDAA